MSNYKDMRNMVENSDNQNNNKNHSKIIIISIISVAVLLTVITILVIMLTSNKNVDNIETPSKSESIVPVSQNESKDNTSSETESIPEIEDDPSIKGYYVNDVFIYNKEGYEIFGGTDTLAVTYSTILSDIADRIDKKITIYNMIVPTHGEYNLPSRYKQMAKSQKDNIQKIYSSYSAGIVPVDIYDTLNRHKLEYTYYHTDYHWTALGAYYAYEQFANVYGFSPTKLTDLTKGEIEGFTGAFINNTKTTDSPNGNEDLLSNLDTVEYYEIPGNYTCRLLENGSDEMVRVPLLYPYSQGGSYTYSKFIWGDNPYMSIVNKDVKNGKKLLVIKDSYGNALVPYLVSNFEEIHIIDYRYYKEKLSDIIENSGITDILFINGIMSANSSYHQNKLIDLQW